jgi:hypothetical protein
MPISHQTDAIHGIELPVCVQCVRGQHGITLAGIKGGIGLILLPSIKTA